MELIERVERRVPLPELLAAFNEPGTSDYLVVYLRLLTSGCLQRHRRFFEQFLEGGRSIKEFCQQVGDPPPPPLHGPCMALCSLARPLHSPYITFCSLARLSTASHGP
ncbi:Ubiquitin thioesterase OTUB1 [Aix galericulata]|nr:Ubiquitin thioesterase OTUB1 [Aix galericulata]